MGSRVVSLPPAGDKVDPKPPKGYVLDMSAPLSKDIDDRRNPDLIKRMQLKAGYTGMRAGQIWDDIKTQVQNKPPPPVDRSFYKPGEDAASRPEPLLGGQSQALQTRKVGELKRFVNGKIGRWDGHGWIQK